MIELSFHSPEEEIHHPLFKKKKLTLFIKRDDLIHPFISGNKWRKLKYPLIQAEAEGKNHLVTFGGVWSNHLLATACAAAKFGFRSTGFVRGEDIHTDTLIFCKLFGMRLIFVDRETYRNKSALFKNHFEADNSAFFIDEGGASLEAAKGCSEVIAELENCYDHLFCACGTGTTAAGLINGLNDKWLSTKFHAISALKGDFLKNAIDNFLLKPQAYEFHQDLHFGGYAKSTPKLMKFIADFASNTGIMLDPVYTGKMMFRIFELAENDYFSAESKILAIHTGGLFGVLGMKQKFIFDQ